MLAFAGEDGLEFIERSCDLVEPFGIWILNCAHYANGWCYVSFEVALVATSMHRALAHSCYNTRYDLVQDGYEQVGYVAA